MDISSTPAIRIHDHGSYHRHHRYPSLPHRLPCYPSYPATARPMSIPSVRESPPPPLPPPRYMDDINPGQDPGWQWGNGADAVEFGKKVSLRPGSSLLGGGSQIQPARRESLDDTSNSVDQERRGSSISTVIPSRKDTDMRKDGLSHSDEDGSSSRLSSNYRLQSEKQLEQRSLEDSSQAYDKQLLSRIGGPSTPNRMSASHGSTSSQDAAQNPPISAERRNSQLRPLSVPDRMQAPLGSPVGRWHNSPSSGAVSPGSTGFRNPNSEPGLPENSRAQRHASFAFEDGASRRGIYDPAIFLEQDFTTGEGGIGDLDINDPSPSGSDDSRLRAGMKRRASSPQREPARDQRPSTSIVAGGNDLLQRRSLQVVTSRNSPVNRFHTNHGSVSSASSFGPRHGSLASSHALSAGSSATSYTSGRLSPGTLSPAIDPELSVGTPYPYVNSHDPSPRGSLSKPPHQRTFSESTQGNARELRTESAALSRQGSGSKIQGVHLCECCPKKPKRFDTEEELRQHEREKQYTCAYCPNRFKNKNEAERHQNSLHLRRHSWSCAALHSPELAFHAAGNSNGNGNNRAVDICGYCGREFANDPPDARARHEHLSHAHKYGECNQAKKFFRADHFRQHLKHSHAGASGKWTNMLENACMKEEPLPVERRAVTGNSVAPAAQMLGAAATAHSLPRTGPSPPIPGAIDEVPYET
ncbi:hypothetical protein LTR66_006284 [Elasticomyces elasticus]|nr:hypothetical protein LTR66_006284 [Elasticomyces elasticus]KAK5008581.1 hypothetical protein LTR28_003782 [Elasticomyces elasticus]